MNINCLFCNDILQQRQDLIYHINFICIKCNYKRSFNRDNLIDSFDSRKINTINGYFNIQRGFFKTLNVISKILDPVSELSPNRYKTSLIIKLHNSTINHFKKFCNLDYLIKMSNLK